MRRIVAYAPFLVLLIAFGLLYGELRHLRWSDFLSSLGAYSAGQLALALGLVAINFWVWSLYDLSSLRQLGEPIPYSEIFRTCAVAFPFTNLIGYSMISGFAIRVKCYSERGLSLGRITQLILFNVEAWWVGFLTITGIALLFVPESGRLFQISAGGVKLLGLALLALIASYLLACGLARGRTIYFRNHPIELPDFKGGLLKLSAGALDGTAIALTFYVLLPKGHSLEPIQFAAFYFVGQLIAIASLVPGGLGVLEGSLLYLLRPYMSDADILSSLVLFRMVHYLIPAGVAVLLLLYTQSRGGPRPEPIANST